MISRKSIVFVILITFLTMPLFAEVVTMNFKNTDIRQIYKLMCRAGKISVVMHKGIRRSISVNFIDMPAEEIVYKIAEDNKLGIVKLGDIFYIYDLKMFHCQTADGVEEKTTAEINNNLKQMQGEGASISYSANFRAKDINLIFKDIAEKAGLEYRTSKGVVGNANLQVSDVLARDAFVALAISQGYSAKRRGNTWIVGYGNDFWLD